MRNCRENLEAQSMQCLTEVFLLSWALQIQLNLPTVLIIAPEIFDPSLKLTHSDRAWKLVNWKITGYFEICS